MPSSIDILGEKQSQYSNKNKKEEHIQIEAQEKFEAQQPLKKQRKHKKPRQALFPVIGVNIAKMASPDR